MAKETKLCMYAQFLSQTKDQKEASQIDFKVESSKLTLETVKLQTRKDLSDASERLSELKRGYPLNFPAIIAQGLKIKELETSVKVLEEVGEELFS